MPAHHSFAPQYHMSPQPQRLLSPENQGMEWTALPTPSSSPTPSHRSPHPTANAFPSELFTRQYLQPMIRYYNSSEPNLPAPPAAVTHLPPPISPRPQHRPTPSSSSGNHKVHEIYCQCDTLLSDRGMKAVLLLNPHITLYSTDSVPSSTGPLAEMGDQGQVKTRTCDCLTEGIGCLCCGSLVGYHILNPCEKCTSSQRQSRSANGHRFVFHHQAVYAKERLYASGQRGLHPSATSSACSSGCSSRTSSPNSTTRTTSRASPAEMVLNDYLLSTANGRKSIPSLSTPTSLDPRASRSPSPSRGRSPSPAYQTLKMGENVYWRHLLLGGDLIRSPTARGGCERRRREDAEMLRRLGSPFGDRRPVPVR